MELQPFDDKKIDFRLQKNTLSLQPFTIFCIIAQWLESILYRIEELQGTQKDRKLYLV